MHMADALLSPTVGVSLWTASGTMLAFCANRLKVSLDDHKVPLMGVLGAFVFAAQMINFTIPGTGSSGHIGGGLLLALLLGPYAAFLTISSVLVIQAFFFADGGLLALGTNMFNLGVFPCFVGLPLFRLMAGKRPSSGRMAAATTVAAVVGLEMGALGVAVETLLSGRSELTFGPFVALMAGIHLPIGLIEGFVTAAVLGYVLKIRPELTAQALGTGPDPAGQPRSLAPVLASLALAALICGGVLTWFASSRPDGLEWSIARVTGGSDSAQGAPNGARKDAAGPAWPAVDKDSSSAGLVGALITLALAAALGLVFSRRRGKTVAP